MDRLHVGTRRLLCDAACSMGPAYSFPRPSPSLFRARSRICQRMKLARRYRSRNDQKQGEEVPFNGGGGFTVCKLRQARVYMKRMQIWPFYAGMAIFVAKRFGQGMVVAYYHGSLD